MSQTNKIYCEDITLLSELAEEIRKYQGVNPNAPNLFGIEYNFEKRIEIDSLTITRQPNWILITGRTDNYSFKIHKFENTLKLEKQYKSCNIDITRFVDNNDNVQTISTITAYKVNNNPLSRRKNVINTGNLTLLCDRDGNFISEEQFWDTHELIDNVEIPYIRHETSQKINDEYVIRRSYKSYYNKDIPSEIRYSKHMIHGTSNCNKILYACGDIDEITYYDLLKNFYSSKKAENPIQKLKSKLFKPKD